jgi:hypothetical protein
MFTTHAAHEFAFPEALLGPDVRCWRAVELSSRLPKFLLTFRDPMAEDGALRSMLFDSLSDVAGIVKSTPSLEVVQIMALHFEYERGEWRSSEVHEIWQGCDARGMRDCFVRDASGAEFDALSYAPLEESVSDRLLVKRVASGAQGDTPSKEPRSMRHARNPTCEG